MSYQVLPPPPDPLTLFLPLIFISYFTREPENNLLGSIPKVYFFVFDSLLVILPNVVEYLT